MKRQIGDDDSSTKMSWDWSELPKLVARNPAKKAMIIGIVLSILTHFSGNFVLMEYTASIFQLSGSVLLPNQSALLSAAVQFVATCIVLFLVERVGRKPLYIASTFGSTVGLTVLGLYIMLKSWNYPIDTFSWIPLFSLSATLFVQALAISTLSITFTAEILPENIREFGLSFCNTALAASGFIVLKFSPFLSQIVGLHVAFFFFGGFCLFSMLFIIFYVPEPKGKSHFEIMKLLE